MIVADAFASGIEALLLDQPTFKAAAREQPEDRPRHFDTSNNLFAPRDSPSTQPYHDLDLRQCTLTVFNDGHVVKPQPLSVPVPVPGHRTPRNLPSPTFSPQDSQATTLPTTADQPPQITVCIDEDAPPHLAPRRTSAGFSATCIRPRGSIPQHSCGFHDFFSGINLFLMACMMMVPVLLCHDLEMTGFSAFVITGRVFGII